MQASYEALSSANKSLVDSFIDLLFKEEQSKANKDTIEAINEADTGNAPYKFSSLDDLSRWIDEDC